MATAAFLGKSSLYRHKDGKCCVNVTKIAAARGGEFSTTSRQSCNVRESGPLGRRGFLAVGLESRVDQRDDPIDHRMTQTLLLGD